MTTTVYSFYPRARTDHGMVAQELMWSAVIGSIFGWIAGRSHQTTAKWVWVVPVLALIFAALALDGRGVPSFAHATRSDLWASGCKEVHGSPCALFYAFTVPSVRTIFIFIRRGHRFAISLRSAANGTR